ncbi:MAG: hypothetical protein EA397_02270 [Deltaproteobacteria bacterium]|nr:MAG: hypothetical protein EA397_02270 [Deltaproteobacteria bacterium]
MPTMVHLRVLSIINYVMTVLYWLVLTPIMLWGLASTALLVSKSPQSPYSMLPMLGIQLPIVGLLIVLGLLALISAILVPLGRGRVPQSILGVLSLATFPLGTLYGIYALWICWFNEETKARFADPSGALEQP